MTTVPGDSFHSYLPRRGFTFFEAAAFLRRILPGETQWMLWGPDKPFVRRLILAGGPEHGAFDGWSWRRMPCPYHSLFYYLEANPPEQQRLWTGLVEVTAPDQRKFLLFSFLNSSGEVGTHYYVSTYDCGLLADFCEALRRHVGTADTIVLAMPYGGTNLQIDVP